MSLKGDLDVDVKEDSVDFKFTVINEGETPTEVMFSSSKRFDFVVFDDGKEVWRWSEGLMFTQALVSDELKPGEQATYDATWENPQEGDYKVVATLEARNVDVEVSEEFVVN